MKTKSAIAYLAARSVVAPSMFPARQFSTLADCPVFETWGTTRPGELVCQVSGDGDSNDSYLIVPTGRGFLCGIK